MYVRIQEGPNWECWGGLPPPPDPPLCFRLRRYGRTATGGRTYVDVDVDVDVDVVVDVDVDVDVDGDRKSVV